MKVLFERDLANKGCDFNIQLTLDKVQCQKGVILRVLLFREIMKGMYLELDLQSNTKPNINLLTIANTSDIGPAK